MGTKDISDEIILVKNISKVDNHFEGIVVSVPKRVLSSHYMEKGYTLVYNKFEEVNVNNKKYHLVKFIDCIGSYFPFSS